MRTESIITVNRRGTDSVKWGLFGDDVLPLWVADTDFQSPPAVIEALLERVTHGVFGYSLHPQELRELVVERMQDRYDWKISSKDMIFIPGVVPGFNLTCQLLTKPGESLLVQTPVYPPIVNAAEKAGVRNICAELVRQPDGSYEVDFDALEASIEKDTCCLIFCNPHNPVGKVYTRQELERLAEICLRHKLTIISDEIHSDLVFKGGQHIPMASLSDEVAKSTVTLIAPSKTFNIAGLSCAVLISTNHGLLKKIENASHGLLGDVNVLGLTAAVAAYRDGGEWLEQMLGILESNRDFMAEFILQRFPQIKMHVPDATYLAWLDCSELALEEGPHKFFLKKAKVALNCGDDFGSGGQGFVRLNFGCSRELLKEALERMEKAINER
ncbi:MAG: putative C-S lyase [Chloroflexi bacterium HGW-Chloroflexi-4]|nr:MAG: putative C-S lyase [Chloroflexi bacterium HGW-Chloroflexi-4]